MNAPHGGDAQKPQGLPVVAVVIGALFFIGLLGLMAYGVMRSGDADRDVLPSALINRPAPDFVLPVLHDPSVTIAAADLRGAPYLLNVWGSWCAACRDEHPVLTKFAETRRVRVVGYNWSTRRPWPIRGWPGWAANRCPSTTSACSGVASSRSWSWTRDDPRRACRFRRPPSVAMAREPTGRSLHRKRIPTCASW